MSKKNIQTLLIKHLMEKGQIELLLPDGVKLEIGVMQLDQEGELINCIEDYCYVVANREDKKFTLDSYNVGLQFAESQDTMLFDDVTIGDDGDPVRRLEII
tara:strand:+ start:811 stop:1113 length:303 start_codon:yes stop_codon:yes gene_type:complete